MSRDTLSGRGWQVALALLAVAILASGFIALAEGAKAQSGSFAHPAFKRIWERTDLPVAQSRVSRTWVWGPTPGRTLYEPFKEANEGRMLVQYFDKARMEVTRHSGTPDERATVTNGLLVVEMISGYIQTGANEFKNAGPNDMQIAGDAGSQSPSYAALQRVASVGLAGGSGRVPPLSPGAPMPPLYMDRQGNTNRAVSVLFPRYTRSLPREVDTMRAGAYAPETGHNIPEVFWRYMNSTGVVYENGQYGTGQLFNWVSTFGYPVTEPYWTLIRVGQTDRIVMFQAFQRRILTYSPENPEGWQVEMSNVGAQYYTWRYERPAITCARVPVRGFGKVWADNVHVQRALGCPAGEAYGPPGTSQEKAIDTAYQPFQQGAMLWVSATVPYSRQERFIYVFFSDNTFQQFDDTWREGQPVSGGLTPPAGLHEPVRGFGKVWREGTGARVRERLGWATAPEKGGPGAYQRFERGEMYWSGAANKIWVLYGTVNAYPYPGYPYPQPVPTSTAGSNPFRYEVFDDTFTP